MRRGAIGFSGAISIQCEAWTRRVLLLLAAVFTGLRALHLRADFPNNSPWMDWSKYTDEGWYGDAAIRHFVLGHWHIAGDFNPAVALPVWPAMLLGVFHFTGVSLPAARALAVVLNVLTLWVIYKVVTRYERRWVAALVVFLLAVSPFNYAFSRLAILEPVLLLLLALAMWLASYADGRRWWPAILLGGMLPLMVLTKTTAVFLFPAVLWLCWSSVLASGVEARRARLLALGKTLLAATGIGAGLWGAYYVGFARRYHADYVYLFSANSSPVLTIRNVWGYIYWTLHGGFWVDKVLYSAAVVVVLLAAVWLRDLWKRPLFTAAVLAAAGYLGFIARHGNMQPRYYFVVLLPVVLVVALGIEYGLERLADSKGIEAESAAGWVSSYGLSYGLIAAVVVAAALNMRQTAGFARHPEYTWWNAARSVAGIIRADHQSKPLLLSISGSDITLMTGLPSICDDFGTEDLETKAQRMKPGWYAAWNELDDGTMADLKPNFQLEKVASFEALDDPDRDLLILYRMIPIEAEKPRSKRKPRSRQVDHGLVKPVNTGHTEVPTFDQLP